MGVRIVVRSFDLLESLGAILARHEDLDVRWVTWQVDDENPSWSAVRADAIASALRKGRDYAQALGASLLAVEHLADTGLLGGSNGPNRVVQAWHATSFWESGGSGDEPDTPPLDPVPQELSAGVEARFRATPAALPD